MRLTESQLRRIIRRALLEEEGPFGDWLFGSDRDKPNKREPEDDTPQEEELRDDLTSHYHGEMGELTKWIDQLVSLKDQGLYTDVLSPPADVKYAYRMMNNVRLETLTGILGYEPSGYEAGEVYEEKTGTFKPLAGREHYSWTINFQKFQNMLKDWGRFTSLSSRGLQFLVFLRAPIAANTFLMNPRETSKMAQRWAYQDEVISVGEVKCDHVWYIPMTDDQIWDNASDIEAKAIEKISDIETPRTSGKHSKRNT